MIIPIIPAAILIGGAILVLFVLLIWYGIYLELVRLDEQVNQAVAALAAQYELRLNLIPDVLGAAREAVKAQLDYCYRFLEVRAGKRPEMSLEQLGALPPDLVHMMNAPTAAGLVFEHNPAIDVGAYTKLQDVMRDTEEGVAAAKRWIADASAQYNTEVRGPFGSIVASCHGFQVIPKTQISANLSDKPDYGFRT